MDMFYKYPYVVLDIGIIAIGVLLYYLLLVTKVFNQKLFIIIILFGCLISFINLLPLKFYNFKEENTHIANRISLSLNAKIFSANFNGFKVKNFNIFIELAKLNYLNFFPAKLNFYFLFLVSLLFFEIAYYRYSWKNHIKYLKSGEET